MKKLAVFFPGIRYSAECPLLYFAQKTCREAGYDLLPLYYSYRQDEELPEDFSYEVFVKKTIGSVCQELRQAGLPTYDEVLFVSKSIGTVLAGLAEQRLEVRPKQFLMTPVQAALPMMQQMEGRAATVLGTKDSHMKAEVLREFCEARGIPLRLYEGLGHRLEAETLEATLEIMRDIMGFLGAFLLDEDAH